MAFDLSADVIELLVELVDSESVSGNEQAIADDVEAGLRGLADLEVTRLGDTVIARTHWQRNERVVLAGHLDTVPVAHNLPSRKVTVSGAEAIAGRGTVDMKGGVAIQLSCAAALAAAGAPRDITWIFYDHEEVAAELNGLNRVAQQRPDLLAADFAILGEPTNGEVEGGCQGTLRANINFSGRAAHSARSWVGSNAIHSAGAALARLADYQPRQPVVDGLTYHEGLNAVAITGGIAGNVIPDQCRLEVNYRYAPDRSPKQAADFVRDFFGGMDVEVTDNSGGARPGLDSAIAQDFVSTLGVTAQPKFGWTDVARFSALGIPAINFGPGDPLLAHTDEEYVFTQQVRDTRAGLLKWLSGSQV